MNTPISVRCCALSAIFTAASLSTAPVWSQEVNNNVKAGKRLFEHSFSPHDELTPKGDGLGPLYNATSCVACHPGGGASKNSVDVVALPPTKKSMPLTEKEANRLTKRAAVVHPAFKSDTGFVLHRYGDGGDYDTWRTLFGGASGIVELKPAVADEHTDLITRSHIARIRGLSLQVAKRDTPSLLGAGMIERISQRAIHDVALQQRKNWPSVTGRTALRFGWRGHVETLDEFVKMACANELGLELGSHHQAMHPKFPDKKVKGIDLDHTQVRDLISFVASLPPPLEHRPVELEPSIARGEMHFESVGCVACHVPTLDRVAGIYSDLLLHDMGPEFDDPLPAMSAKDIASSQRSKGGKRGSGGYSGGRRPTSEPPESPGETITRREWKTPPLWGIRDTAPYLHDGRAATLQQAIELHGGEAEFAAKRYHELSADDQAHLVTFVRSLGAPATPPPTATEPAIKKGTTNCFGCGVEFDPFAED